MSPYPPVHDLSGGSSPPVLALRRRQAAKAMGISERTLTDLTSQGRVPHVRFGRAVVYPTAALAEWLSEQAGRQVKP